MRSKALFLLLLAAPMTHGLMAKTIVSCESLGFPVAHFDVRRDQDIEKLTVTQDEKGSLKAEVKLANGYYGSRETLSFENLSFRDAGWYFPDGSAAPAPTDIEDHQMHHLKKYYSDDLTLSLRDARSPLLKAGVVEGLMDAAKINQGRQALLFCTVSP